MSAAPLLVIAAGGTGGHVYPALAVARALQAHSREVVWLGTHRGLESRVVPEAGIDIEWISIKGLRRKGALAVLIAPLQIGWALLQSLAALFAVQTFRVAQPLSISCHRLPCGDSCRIQNAAACAGSA